MSFFGGLGLALATLTLAAVARLVLGKLGALAVPIWTVTLPSAIHCCFCLASHPLASHLDMSPPWMLVIAPFIAFCTCLDADRVPRTWLEDLLVITLLANVCVATWCAGREAMSV